GLPRAAAGLAARAARELGQARDLRGPPGRARLLQPLVPRGAVGPPPGGHAGPQLRPVVPGQPRGVVRTLDRRAQGGMSASEVLYIVDGLGLSGKTKAMVDLIAGLDPARFHATVICFDTEKSSLAARLLGMGVEVIEVPCPEGVNLGVVARLGAVAR